MDNKREPVPLALIIGSFVVVLLVVSSFPLLLDAFQQSPGPSMPPPTLPEGMSAIFIPNMGNVRKEEITLKRGGEYYKLSRSWIETATFVDIFYISVRYVRYHNDSAIGIEDHWSIGVPVRQKLTEPFRDIIIEVVAPDICSEETSDAWVIYPSNFEVLE